jgi:hypothetical protein
MAGESRREGLGTNMLPPTRLRQSHRERFTARRHRPLVPVEPRHSP